MGIGLGTVIFFTADFAIAVVIWRMLSKKPLPFERQVQEVWHRVMG